MHVLLAVLALPALLAAQDVNVFDAKSEGLSSHTIYAPKSAGKIPVLVWSSGGCIRDGGSQHAPALREAASHGVMIIAMGVLGRGKGGMGGGMPKMGGKGGKGGKGMGGGGMGGMGADVTLMNEALSWVAKHAGTGKHANLDKTRVAVAGQSCGGIESYNVAKNPLVKTIGIFNSGMFGSSPIVKSMQKPIFYFLGGSSDIAYKNGERDFKELPAGTPTWKGNLPVGHMATYRQARGGKFGVAMWKWLDWTLRGNTNSSTFFTGNGAGSATADGWSVAKKNLDKIRVSPI